MHGLSDWFCKDPRVLHVDILEALFYEHDEEEVYQMYHVCGPNCENMDKAAGVRCTEAKCGLRVWSIRFTTFTTTSQEHDLKPTSYSKEEEVQAIYMSLVRFFDGQFKARVNKKPQKFIFEYWAFSQKSYLNGGCFEEIHICIPKILYLHTS